MKRLIKLFVLLGVLALLVIAYLIFMLVHSSNEDEYDDEIVPPMITTYTAAQIDIKTMSALSYATATDEYCFELNSAGNAWIWTSNTALPLDNVYFASMASALERVTTETKLKVTETELVNYGLSVPWMTITVSDSTNGTQTFSFGLPTNDGEKYYFSSTANSDCVYTVSADIVSPFGMTPYQMVKNDILPTIDPERIQRIEFSSSNDIITYTYYDGGKDEDNDTDDYWYMTVHSEDEKPLHSSIIEIIGDVYDTIDFSAPIGYTKEDQKAFGLTEATTLTIYYSERKTVTDSNTGASATVTVDKSFSLLLGYMDAQGKLYACLPDSVLSYSIDASILSKLYNTVSTVS